MLIAFHPFRLGGSLGWNGVGLHLQATMGATQGGPEASLDSTSGKICGKLVLFAHQELSLAEGALLTAVRNLKANRLTVADIPSGAQRIEQGHPVCTIVADGVSPNEVGETLQAGGNQLMQELDLADLGRER